MKTAIAFIIAALVFTLWAVGCSDAFGDSACTLDARQYPIKADRDVDSPFTDAASLSVEACALRPGQSPTCAVVAAVSDGAGAFVLGSTTDSVEGKLTSNPSEAGSPAKTKLTLTVHVGEGEPGSTTTITVRVLKANAATGKDDEVLKFEGPLHWSKDDCHPTADAKSI